MLIIQLLKWWFRDNEEQAMLTEDQKARRKAFNIEVRAFKERNNIKLSQLFYTPEERRLHVTGEKILSNSLVNSIESGRIQSLRKEFLSNPTINTYLAREAGDIHFILNRPNLNNPKNNNNKGEKINKEEKIDSDYYELRIYHLSPKIAPFREYAQTDDFYKKGNSHNELDYYYSKLHRNTKVQGLLICVPQDIYQIGGFIRTEEIVEYEKENGIDGKEKARIKFIITPNFKDDHATLLFHVIDEGEGRPLLSIFINSVDNIDYYGNMRCRFHVNRKERTTVPFINASHNLQLESEDMSCAIYGINFTNAIINMLEDENVSNRIFELAKQVDKDKNNGKGTDEPTAASEELSRIFSQDLKSYLPYYHKDGKPKPYKEIKELHLKQRWNLGSEAIKENLREDLLSI